MSNATNNETTTETPGFWATVYMAIGMISKGILIGDKAMNAGNSYMGIAEKHAASAEKKYELSQIQEQVTVAKSMVESAGELEALEKFLAKTGK